MRECGFGLVNVKRVIEAHNGTIHIESEEGKGTIVTLKVPINTQLENKA